MKSVLFSEIALIDIDEKRFCFPKETKKYFMSGRDWLCRHRVGTMSKLVGMWRAMAMSMSKRDVIKKFMSSGLGT